MRDVMCYCAYLVEIFQIVGDFSKHFIAVCFTDC